MKTVSLSLFLLCALSTPLFAGGFEPPVDLTCTVLPDTGEVEMSWTNSATYGFIGIVVDGTQVDTIAGTDTSYTVTGLGLGGHVLCVRAYLVTGLALPDVCCDVDITGEFPPTDLVCEVDATGAVALSWQNNGSYIVIELFVDGVLVGTVPGSATSATVTVDPGSHTICIRPRTASGPLGFVCCEVDSGVIGELPEDLTCSLLATAPGIFVSWTNLDSYSSIEVYVDGTLYTTLPGSATSTAITGLAPGLHEVCLRVYKLGTYLGTVCCEIDTTVIGELPEEMTCSLLATAPGVLVSWINLDSYSSIEVIVDGTLYATLPGSATSTIVTGLPAGLHEICLRVFKLGSYLGMVCCEIEVGVTGEEPADLECGPLPGAPGIQVTWTIMDSYTSIEIYVDGALDQTLPGTASSAAVLGLSTGVHEICVLAYKNGLPLPEVCCTVTIGDPVIRFVRGDCNGDTMFNIGDPIAILDTVISGTFFPQCRDACDANDDGSLNIADSIFTLSALFTFGAPLPPAPHAACGLDPTADPLGCGFYPCP